MRYTTVNLFTGFLLLMIGMILGYMLGGVFSANKSAESNWEDFEEFQRQHMRKAHSEDTEG